MLIMQGKLEDSDSRIQNIKQIHDQQNKKIKQIDQEKVKIILYLTWKISSYENHFQETLSKENRKWHYETSRNQFRYMNDTVGFSLSFKFPQTFVIQKSLIRQVETNGIEAARQSLNQRIKNAKRNRNLRPVLERGDSGKKQ